ncbi:DUF4259 domain-containing protein [Micromonospora sp. CPCC 205371]|nr:DUF4259 domain-containing protein [Micromonospora sp. CPCC 205371]
MRRAGQIRDALSLVAEHGDEYLDGEDAVEAIAAAAIVDSQLPGGTVPVHRRARLIHLS